MARANQREDVIAIEQGAGVGQSRLDTFGDAVESRPIKRGGLSSTGHLYSGND